MKTPIAERLGLRLPILQAPMGGVAGPALVTAVCEAGGLGMLPIWPMSPDAAERSLSELKAQTSAPFAVNLNVAFGPTAMLELALAFGVPVIHFFWGDAAPFVARAKSSGATVIATVGNAE